MQRRLGIAALDQSLRFVDIAAPETREQLARDLASVLEKLGVLDLDLSVITSKDPRRPTQVIARHVYDLTDESGMPMFAGIRYISRLCVDWELWAVFADRLVSHEYPSVSICPDNPDLLAACRRLGLKPPRAF